MSRDIDNGGYTRIHNEILEELAAGDFTNREFRCLLFLLRKTYGYQQTSDSISLDQWSKGTKIKKPHVSETLKRLAERNVIVITKHGAGRGNSSRYSFNKYFEKWTVKGTHGGNINFTEKVPTGVTEKVPTGVTEKVPTGVPTKERKKEKERAGAELNPQRQEIPADPMPQPTHTNNNNGLHKNIDPRKIQADGLIPEGQGETVLEIYRESFRATPTSKQIRLMNQTVTDLIRWRMITSECGNRGWKSPYNVIDAYVNGFKDGKFSPQAECKSVVYLPEGTL